MMLAYDKAERIVAALSGLIDFAQAVVARYSAHSPDTSLKVNERIAVARRLVIEGGNPIGSECPHLCNVLEDLQMARRNGEDARARQWEAVAGTLLPMVRDTLDLALKRRRHLSECQPS